MNRIDIKVGTFLALRQVRHASFLTTALIISVMTLTFLNLVVVNGILVGLVKTNANNKFYSGDVIVSPLREKSFIERSADIVRMAEAQNGVVAVSARYIESGRLEANYKTRLRQTDLINDAGGQIVGINPDDEDMVTQLSSKIIEGSYLEEGDYDQILVGSDLLFKYAQIDSPGVKTLRDTEAGSKVRLVIGDIEREVTIKGVVKAKVGEVDSRIFMIDNQLRSLINRFDYNVDEISIRLEPGADASVVKQALIDAGFDKKAKVLLADEAKPKFLQDVEKTFGLMGNLIGSIGLVVASITIFIVIFVNALTRRKFIGILKGIGISSRAIEFSYVIQSLFYAGCGTLIGLFVVYGILKPYIDVNPINFPFSDGILFVPISGTMLRVLTLMITTIIAGYLPAKLIVRQNTLNAILGR